MDNIVNKWVEIAEYDFTTAKAMFKTGRYLYVAFMCQQALEKMLKAIIVLKTDKFPPKVHKLEFLANLSGINNELNEQQKDLLNELSFFYLNNRYPDFKIELNKLISKEKSLSLIEDTEELLKWIKQKIK